MNCQSFPECILERVSEIRNDETWANEIGSLPSDPVLRQLLNAAFYASLEREG